MWDSNPYYNPENLGLEIVAILEREPCWDFNMLIVWKDKNNKHYYASDSGCSCPSPFEDYNDINSLERVHKKNFKKFEEYARQWNSYNNVPAAELSEKIAKVRASIWA